MSGIASRDVLDFWFKETPPERWFAADLDFDAAVRARFEDLWQAAREGKLAEWEKDKDSALALIVVLDQFPRNMFRGDAKSFATDALARSVADRAIARGFDLAAPSSVRSFFYLPLMHSEDLADQETCVKLTAERLGTSDSTYPYAIRHRDVIARFGRFPARNAALQRVSTAEENAFLAKNPSGL